MRPLIIIDIDGLRFDVLSEVIERSSAPALSAVLGKAPFLTRATSVAPSITFAAQASIVTGSPPGAHGMVGNNLFCRLGLTNQAQFRHYGFDVGDTLAVDDALATFTTRLADHTLLPEVETIFERCTARGKTSLVTNLMYSRGATHVITPSLFDLARFIKGKGFLGLEHGAFDRIMLTRFEAALSELTSPPDLMMLYFMGLDGHSHRHGPASQREYLERIIDPEIQRLEDFLGSVTTREAYWLFVSDHGQSETAGDDTHSIRIGFPFDPELKLLFDSLGLSLHYFFGESESTDVVVGLNGGMAHVYRRRSDGAWRDPPRFEELLYLAKHLMDSTLGRNDHRELQGCIEAILVRNSERDGWNGSYSGYLPSGQVVPLGSFMEKFPWLEDPVHRIQSLSCSRSGDLLLLASAREGYYFGKEGMRGVHGSLIGEDSGAILALSCPAHSPEEQTILKEKARKIVARHCERDGGRKPSIMDAAHLAKAVLDGEL